jgi:hypothetical protein
MDDLTRQLARIHRVKQQPRYSPASLGEEAITLFNKDIRKRHEKFGKISEAWATLVPELLRERATLSAYTKGTLTVLVDSASHMYELRQLLGSGLEAQLKVACASEGLRKVSLKRGGTTH